MSMEAIRWARSCRGLTPTQKLVLLVLADAARDGVCWMGAAALADDTGLSDRAVRTALHDLIEAGAIAGEMRSGVRPLWTLAVSETGTTFEEKRNGLPVSKRNHVPVNRKQVPDRNRKHVPPNRKHVPSEPETRSVKPEPVSDEPKRTRIEPEGTHKGGVGLDLTLPPWVPPAAWADWCAFRKRKSGKGWTQRGAELSLADLGKLHAQGHDPRAVIEQSIANGWAGLFPMRVQGGFRQAPPTEGRRAASMRLFREGFAGPGFDLDITPEGVTL